MYNFFLFSLVFFSIILGETKNKVLFSGSLIAKNHDFYYYMVNVFKRHDLIRASENKLKQQKYKDLYILSEFLPNISFNVDTGYRSDRDSQFQSGDEEGARYAFSYTFTQILYQGGARSARIGIYNIDEKEALAEKERTQNEVFLDALEIYLNLNRYQEVAKIYKQYYQLTKKLLESVQQRFDLGDAKKSTLLLTKASLRESEARLDQVKHELNLSRAAYENISKLKLREKQNIEEVPIFETRELSWEHFLSLSMGTDPVVALEELERKRKKFEYQVERARGFPSISLSFGQTRLEGEYNSDINRGTTNFGLQFNYDLQSGRTILNSLRSKFSFKEELDISRERQRNYERELRIIWERRKTLKKQLDIYRRAVKLYKESQEVLLVEFKEGLISVENVIHATEQFVAAKENFLRAQQDEYEARYELLLKIGGFYQNLRRIINDSKI